ncbi:MAG: serine/threonine protein kinase [Myxococcales bacterium]|nr:serine/threonine protein kinase [Myxococcales bacterium]
MSERPVPYENEQRDGATHDTQRSRRTPATGAATDGSSAHIPAAPEEQRHHLLEARQRIRAYMPWALVIAVCFIVLDFFQAKYVLPVRLDVLLATHATLVVAVAITLRLLQGIEPDERSLHRFSWQATALLAVPYAALCAAGGGMLAIYPFGLVFVFTGFALLGRPWRSMLAQTLAMVSAVPIAFAVGALFSPLLAAQWSDPRSIVTMILTLGATTAMGGTALYTGHLLWALRREIFESKRVGPYVLRKRIGWGGFGEVWTAWNSKLNREVALKFLRGRAESADGKQRFEREIKALRALSHRNVVQIFDGRTTGDGQRYFAMELLEGETLASLVHREGPLHPSRAVALIAQAARGLGSAHEARIVHRDVKPDNLFVCAGSDPTVKVLDFGIATMLADEDAERLTATGFLAGTPAWVCPEAIEGRPVSPASDVYSLCAVLYFALTRTPPFLVDGENGVLYSHLHVPPLPPSVRLSHPIPPALEAIVSRGLSKDPAERFSDGNALADALETCDLTGATEVPAGHPSRRRNGAAREELTSAQRPAAVAGRR